MARLFVASVTAAFFVVTFHCSSRIEAKRSGKDWNKVDWDAVANEWDEGDEEVDKMTEDNLEFKRMEQRRANLGSIDTSNPGAAVHQKSMAGPTMQFAKLDIEGKKGDKALQRKDVETIARQWQDKLFLGGVTVTCYVIEDDTILATMQHGWNGNQLKEFLLDQKHVKQVTWDSQTYKLGETSGRAEIADKTKETKKKKKNRQKKKKKKKTTHQNQPPKRKATTPNAEHEL